MVTRGEVRDWVRLRLEDTGVGVLWNDAEILDGCVGCWMSTGGRERTV